MTNAPGGIDAVELIGDEEVGGDGGAPVANPRSILAPAQAAALRALLGDAVRLDEPLRRHTTLKIGGPADAFVEPASAHDVAVLARWCAAAGLPITVVGGGSNLLVRDGGVRGVVLGTGKLRGLELVAPSTIRVEAGVSTGKVLSLALKNDLGGIEFLGGVPGSVGGGMIMNAGTYLGEFKDVTSWVETVRLSDGEVIRRDNAACGFRYRDSDLPPTEVVVAAQLALYPRPRAEIQAEVVALRKRRAEREPKKVSSNGSTFKNPPGEFAGRLIEAAGCKGWREGDAVCSPVHANWLVNTGRATADQLLALIERVRAEVARVHGITLELEVKIIGEDAGTERSPEPTGRERPESPVSAASGPAESVPGTERSPEPTGRERPESPVSAASGPAESVPGTERSPEPTGSDAVAPGHTPCHPADEVP